MTETELLEKIDEYRKEYVNLFSQVGVGAGYSRGGYTDNKYDSIIWEKPDGDQVVLSYSYEDVQAQIDFIHYSICNLVREYNNQHGQLNAIAKMVIKNLLKSIETNCDENYLNTLKNVETYPFSV